MQKNRTERTSFLSPPAPPQKSLSDNVLLCPCIEAQIYRVCVRIIEDVKGASDKERILPPPPVVTTLALEIVLRNGSRVRCTWESVKQADSVSTSLLKASHESSRSFRRRHMIGSSPTSVSHSMHSLSNELTGGRRGSSPPTAPEGGGRELKARRFFGWSAATCCLLLELSRSADTLLLFCCGRRRKEAGRLFSRTRVGASLLLPPTPGLADAFFPSWPWRLSTLSLTPLLCMVRDGVEPPPPALLGLGKE